MVKKITPFIIVIILAVISVLPLLHSGLIPTHDGEYHVVRFYEFDKTLRAGSLYPRWAEDFNNGFGIPLFNYVYPLPNYIASLLHFFGTSFIDAFKLNMFLASILGAIFFYLWAKEFWGKLGAVVSSVFYTFSPYHFVDIYIRGSVGEVWALAFFPAALWSITRYFKSGMNMYGLLASVFLALVIFSHNILALMFFVFLLTYAGFLIIQDKNKKKLIAKFALVLVVGLGLSSIFWLPALWEKSFVKGLDIYNLKSNFPELFQLLIPSWGSGFSAGSLENQMSFQIGMANILAIFAAVLILIKKIIRKNKKRYLFAFFIGWFFLVFYLMLQSSLWVWQKMPLMNFFQFPWRFLSLEILFASFLAGGILVISKRFRKTLAVFLIFFVFIFGIGYAKPPYYFNRDDIYYISRPNFISGTNSPGNAFNTIWLNKVPEKSKEKLKFNGVVSIKTLNTTSYSFDTVSENDQTLKINTAYFPGWTAYLDGKKIQVKNNNGLISIFIPRGIHNVQVNFKNTAVRNIAMLISLASVMFLFAWFAFNNYAKLRK